MSDITKCADGAGNCPRAATCWRVLALATPERQSFAEFWHLVEMDDKCVYYMWHPRTLEGGEQDA